MSRPLHPIRRIVRDGTGARGICSVCSASEVVIEATCRRATELGAFALIESTANQVNQFGGYTGMKPVDFARRVQEIADSSGLPRSRLILGGDHLGPLVWQAESEADAMGKAADLVRAYVAAGYTKIHLDTSMRLGTDSKSDRLPDETIASRAVDLAKAVDAARLDGHAYAFVVGSEVPIPGGAQEEEALSITSPEAFSATVETFRRRFGSAGLESMYEEVVAVVVQPGVEFGDDSVHYYDRAKAASLSSALSSHSGLCFEGHSTDYQPPKLLRQMVEDGIRILKVGPALTFYQREALFALEMIERELAGKDDTELSQFRETLDRVMVENPEHWKKYYHGSEEEIARKRAFSFSDRCRYYLPNAAVRASVDRLISNLNRTGIPPALLSQYMPIQAEKVASGAIEADAGELILSRITDCLDTYMYATGASGE